MICAILLINGVYVKGKHEDELACKKIYEEAKKYDIYVGDFVKAILKIVNICNEIEKCAKDYG